MDGLKHRFVWLQVVNGEVRVEAGPEIPTPARLAVDPQLPRFEWREPLELLAQAFAAGGTSGVLERIDRAVSTTARPGLRPRPVQMIDVDDAGGGFRAICSMGELATISRVNLIVDTAALFGEHLRVAGAKRVQQLLDDFAQWLANAPDPFPNVEPPMKQAKQKAKKPDPLEERVAALETRFDAALEVPSAPATVRH